MEKELRVNAQKASEETQYEIRKTIVRMLKTYEGGIDGFMKNEVLPYAPDAYIDEKKTQIGYEISFTKYFYKPVELREMSDILAELQALEQQADGMMAEIMEGISL